MKYETKCLNPDCEEGAMTRGLCYSCYQSAAGLVKRKRVTWDALVAAGKVRPAGLAGRRRTEKTGWLLSTGKAMEETNAAKVS